MVPPSICAELQQSIRIMLHQRPPQPTAGRLPTAAEAAAEAAAWATTYQVAGDLYEGEDDDEDSQSDDETWWAENRPTPTGSEEEEMVAAADEI